MAIQIHRYRTLKPQDGHFKLDLHEGASVMAYAEHFHTDKGWEVVVDAMVNLRKPLERRCFWLATQGDTLDALDPDSPDLYFVAKHESKAYVSYLFETSHLSDQEREKLVANWTRLGRRKPTRDEMSYTERRFEDRKARERAQRAQPPGPPNATTAVAQAVEEARAASS